MFQNAWVMHPVSTQSNQRFITIRSDLYTINKIHSQKRRILDVFSVLQESMRKSQPEKNPGTITCHLTFSASAGKMLGAMSVRPYVLQCTARPTMSREYLRHGHLLPSGYTDPFIHFVLIPDGRDSLPHWNFFGTSVE